MRLLWISRLGFQSSYWQVSKDLLSTRPKDIDLYVFTTTISPLPKTIDNIASELHLPYDHIFYPTVEYNMTTPEDREYETLALSGYHDLPNVIKRVNPDILVVLDDSKLIKSICPILNTTCIKIAYMPIDCDDYPLYDFNSVNYDMFMTMTNHSKDIFDKHLTKKTFVLPHMIDPTRFKKVSFNIPEPFTVVSVNANHIRK